MKLMRGTFSTASPSRRAPICHRSGRVCVCVGGELQTFFLFSLLKRHTTYLTEVKINLKHLVIVRLVAIFKRKYEYLFLSFLKIHHRYI